MRHEKKFLEKVKSVLPEGYKIGLEFRKILGIDRHRASRVANGKNKLTIDEQAELALHCNISLDELYGLRPHAVMFAFAKLDLSKPAEYRSYLHRLKAVLDNARASPDLKLVYVVDDLPIFYALEFPLLTYFKLFAWYRDMNPHDEVHLEDFIARLEGEGLEPLFESVSRAYRNLPSTEIWFAHSLMPLLLHLKYYRKLKAFKHKETWRRLVGQLDAMLKKVETYAATGKKDIGEGCELEMCLSPVHPGHGKLLITTGGNRRVVLKLHSISSMATGDVAFCEEVHGAVDGIERKCKSLSGKSEIPRSRYFRRSRKRVGRLRKKGK